MAALVESLSPEVIAQIKAIQIRTQRAVTDLLAGDYESAFKGRGMEFEEVREYQRGDDIRHIDWNVTARMSTPYVKQHREERELSVILVVDVSSSGRFGSGRRTKSEVAAEVAAVLAYAAIQSNDKVGVILFSDHVEMFVPPKKGRSHVWRVIREILTHSPRREGTDISGALDYLAKVVRRRSVVFLVSDFYDDGFEESLKRTAKRHDLTAVTVRDPREAEMPRIGLLELRDAETGETRIVDTLDRGSLDRFRAATRREEGARERLLRSVGVGEIRIETGVSYVDAILRYFRRRERARWS